MFSPSDPFVCTKCYKRLLRFEKIKTNLRTVQEEIKEDYKKGELRTKRLRRDSELDASIVSIESSTVQQRCTAAKSEICEFSLPLVLLLPLHPCKVMAKGLYCPKVAKIIQVK